MFDGFYSVLLRVPRRQNGSVVAFVDPHYYLYNAVFSLSRDVKEGSAALYR
jgi:hypothetical protein